MRTSYGCSGRELLWLNLEEHEHGLNLGDYYEGDVVGIFVENIEVFLTPRELKPEKVQSTLIDGDVEGADSIPVCVTVAIRSVIHVHTYGLSTTGSNSVGETPCNVINDITT